MTNLYTYDQFNDTFLPYSGNNGWTKIDKILNIIEDNQRNIWISCNNAIYKLGSDKKNVRIYTAENGVHTNFFGFANNYKTKNGKLLLGDQGGYYSFLPEQLSISSYPPKINIIGFQVGDEAMKPLNESTTGEFIYNAKDIRLPYYQHNFSFTFLAIHYTSPGEEKYQYLLENYDNVWHDSGPDHRAYFFNVPPGNYTFHVRAMNYDGVWSEVKINIIIMPPWWQTGWAITLFVLLMIGLVWLFYYIRSKNLRKENRLLEEKVNQRTSQLQLSLTELKTTQTQLIQSEKMASLVQLTAGIAHEIQNPLNFVNNFSEVNHELLTEIKNEIDKGNFQEVKNIAFELEQNIEKITHHGKRADAIVKSMLQHSRISKGQKDPTDINALANEYLRLSYLGLRAKEKTINVTLLTDFDASIGKINLIAQDIGRVLLNLYNNAFYAVAQKNKKPDQGYEPNVTVTTKKENNTVLIKVKDNGPGVPQKVLEKIFQPFFTTKPTGEGIGLGLSLSYDIIKAHGGEITIETKEGMYAEFIIKLPV